jgi:hypothetical protein
VQVTRHGPSAWVWSVWPWCCLTFLTSGKASSTACLAQRLAQRLEMHSLWVAVRGAKQGNS